MAIVRRRVPPTAAPMRGPVPKLDDEFVAVDPLGGAAEISIVPFVPGVVGGVTVTFRVVVVPVAFVTVTVVVVDNGFVVGVGAFVV